MAVCLSMHVSVCLSFHCITVFPHPLVLRRCFISHLLLCCFATFYFLKSWFFFINFFLHSFHLSFFTFPKVSFSFSCGEFLFCPLVTICSFNISPVFPLFLHLHSRPNYAYPFSSFFFSSVGNGEVIHPTASIHILCMLKTHQVSSLFCSLYTRCHIVLFSLGSPGCASA